MKKIALVLSILLFSSSAFAGSCPMMAKGVDAKIADASSEETTKYNNVDAGQVTTGKETETTDTNELIQSNMFLLVSIL